MSKKHKKFRLALNYMKKLLILTSVVSGSVVLVDVG